MIYRLCRAMVMWNLCQLEIFKECGIHIYVGKVYPTMRMKTDEGKNCSRSVVSFLEGKGPKTVERLAAFCKCKGDTMEDANISQRRCISSIERADSSTFDLGI